MLDRDHNCMALNCNLFYSDYVLQPQANMIVASQPIRPTVVAHRNRNNSDGALIFAAIAILCSLFMLLGGTFLQYTSTHLCRKSECSTY